jgi:hypothetical protein
VKRTSRVCKVNNFKTLFNSRSLKFKQEGEEIDKNKILDIHNFFQLLCENNSKDTSKFINFIILKHCLTPAV